jgi:chemotaxis methyl-accepting protein methylase
MAFMSAEADRDGGSARDLAESVAILRDALRARSGLSEDAISSDRLRIELAAAIRDRGGDAHDAARAILADPVAFAALEAAFAPPETWLFRYPPSFELVRERAAGWGSGEIRAVVAGAGGWCEPCALAAALLAGSDGRCAVRVLAIDRNPEVFAGSPRFSGLALRGGMPDWARRYFHADGDGVRPVKAVLDAIEARVSDARSFVRDARQWRGSKVVAFRNVSIYLDHEVRMGAFRALAELLAADGLLLVGHAEAHAARVATSLESERTEGAFALVHPPGAAADPSVRWMDRREPSGKLMDRPAPRRPPSPSDPVAGSGPRPDSGECGARSANPEASAMSAGVDPQVGGLPTAADFLEEARAHEIAGDIARAVRAVGRALYLDPRNEDALVLAARLADARGDRAESDRFRARALRVHLAREDLPPLSQGGA